MGKRQRHSHLVRFTIEELERMAKDKSKPPEERLKIVAELKFWKKRNRQKRSK